MLETIPQSLDWAHPIVREWFLTRFGSPTEPQIEGWPKIVNGENVLISAPTGSGKTLAAFLACIDKLVRKSIAGNLEPKTEVVYVSPLKALSNDIQKNLEGPLTEILELAKAKGYDIEEIRTAVRSGDTPQSQRQSMLRKPPHILVTTPESLYILLTAEKSRLMLSSAQTLIVDEIHAIAGDKRGSHLSITIERLIDLVDKPPVRIGLSATQKPIEEIGHFLVGNENPLPTIVDVGSRRKLDVKVEVSNIPLLSVATHEIWEEIYDRIAGLVKEHKSTLVFVNTRRLAERISHNLVSRLGEDAVGAHHGSLSRDLRLEAEQKLKEGKYKVLIATASLELGIDIGDIDLVCQIGSPRSIAISLQRIGRAGHFRGAVPKGRFFATTRDELIECAALVKAVYGGELDKVLIPDKPIDILAQQIVATCATGDWLEKDLFDFVKRAYPYRNLTIDEFESVLAMLSEGIAGRNFRYARYLHRDTINNRISGRRGARLTAITNGGAIPDNALFTVLQEPEDTKVGTLDEDFAIESNKGDIILLGNTSWEIKRIEGTSNIVRVVDAKGQPPNVPFWLGEAPARTKELSQYVSELKESIFNSISNGHKDKYPAEAVVLLNEECGLSKSAAEQVIDYIRVASSVLGTVPTQTRVVAERFFDESGGMQLVIHAPFGGRINKAWGLALRKRFCKSFNIELQAAATNDGIIISLTNLHSFPLADVFQFLSTNTLRDVLEQTVLVSPFFTVRWRWDANRSLALKRFEGGKKVPPHLQRMRAEDLLAAVFPDAAACQDNIVGKIPIPDHPLVNEVMKDVLTEAMDIDGLSQILTDMKTGKIECVAVDTKAPSEFCAEILNANPYAFLDDAPLEERRARAVQMRQVLPDNVANDLGFLNEESISKVVLAAVPDIRDRDELHDVLMSKVFIPPDHVFENGESASTMWGGYFDILEAEGRARTLSTYGENVWVATEKLELFKNLLTSEVAIDQLTIGWLMHTGPIRCESLAKQLSMPDSIIDQSLIRLESKGLILRGKFTPNVKEEEWCDRVLLSRIHKDTIAILRKKIKPVSKAAFLNWLFSWQHLTPVTHLYGERGVLEIIRQLEGFEISAIAWEQSVISNRIADYKTEYLDSLTLKGIVGWGRLSLHPSIVRQENESNKEIVQNRRITPTSVSPISFYNRESTDWSIFRTAVADSNLLNTKTKKVYEMLDSKGASFFLDIVRETKLLKSEVEDALWELVTAGLGSADNFDNLRALINPKRRAGLGRYKTKARPRDSQGRWSLTTFNTTDKLDSDKLETICRILLKRYGVVFRDLLHRESNLPQWRDLLTMFRRLEAQGQIRGGRFVSGFVGEQFALPEAVESLRMHNSQKEDKVERVEVSASDPLNLVGILVPGDRVSASSGKTIVFENGVFIETKDV